MSEIENTPDDLKSDDQTEAVAQAEYFAVFEFKGKELKPFSEGRRAAAQALGVKILNGVEIPEDGALYQGAVMDCHIILWLVAAASQLEIVQSHRAPDKILQKVVDWVDQNITTADYAEEINLVGEIVKNAYATKVVPVTKPGELKKPELGNG